MFLLFKSLIITSQWYLLLLFLNNSLYADILTNKFDDIETSVTPGQVNDLVMTERICVGSNPSGPFSLMAFGSGDGGEFVISNGPINIPYDLFINDRFSRLRFTQVQPGRALSGLQSRSINNAGRCRGNSTGLRVIISSDSLKSAVSGTYQGSLQVMVIPE